MARVHRLGHEVIQARCEAGRAVLAEGTGRHSQDRYLRKARVRAQHPRGAQAVHHRHRTSMSTKSKPLAPILFTAS
jgi:hypothetical protein